MELPDILNTQYGFHCLIVGSVIFCAILVFVFGFKSAEEPPFDKLTYTNEDRKPAGKKRKLKDKKAQSNGHATAVGDTKKSEQKASLKKDVDKSPMKEPVKSNKEEKKLQALREAKENKNNRKADNNNKMKGKGKENVEVKNKKNQEEKPKDFDDGEWEQALSRKDKMKRKAALEEILPQKTEKKRENKKKNKVEEIEVVEELPQVEIESKTEEKVKEKPLPVEEIVEVESTNEVEAKPKKSKKKKQPEPPGAAPDDVIAGSSDTEAKPQRAKKQETQPTPPGPKVEPFEVPSESNVAFDELGDTWKEAKAPKKTAKKKSRKD